MKTCNLPAAAVSAALAIPPLFACGSPPPEEFVRDPADPYHILVSNDDGIASPGVQQLADALRTVGDVTVVAPCGQRSGSGMSIRLDLEKRLTPYQEDGETRGHCVDATPAGAVLVAIDALAPEGGFDLVVSGINAGANVGSVAPMSGTVGAAMMGAYKGVPAVAASLGDYRAGFGYAAAFVARFVEELKGRAPLPGIVFSINFPTGAEDEIAGVAVGPDGGWSLRLRIRGGGRGRWRARLSPPLRTGRHAPTRQRWRGLWRGYDHRHSVALRPDRRGDVGRVGLVGAGSTAGRTSAGLRTNPLRTGMCSSSSPRRRATA